MKITSIPEVPVHVAPARFDAVEPAHATKSPLVGIHNERKRFRYRFLNEAIAYFIPAVESAKKAKDPNRAC